MKFTLTEPQKSVLAYFEEGLGSGSIVDIMNYVMKTVKDYDGSGGPSVFDEEVMAPLVKAGLLEDTTCEECTCSHYTPMPDRRKIRNT